MPTKKKDVLFGPLDPSMFANGRGQFAFKVPPMIVGKIILASSRGMKIDGVFHGAQNLLHVNEEIAVDKIGVFNVSPPYEFIEGLTTTIQYTSKEPGKLSATFCPSSARAQSDTSAVTAEVQEFVRFCATWSPDSVLGKRASAWLAKIGL